MIYDVDLKLVLISVNKLNPANSLVLIQQGKRLRKLPSMPLHYGKSFICICTEEMNKIFGLTGQWKETRPKQIGVFETDNDKLLLVYSLLLPETMEIKKEGYEWLHFDDMDKILTEDWTKEIIKFAAIQGDNYVV